MHFNPFHDPKNGQFTSGGNGTTRSGARRYQKALNKLEKKAFDADIKSQRESQKEEKNNYVMWKYIRKRKKSSAESKSDLKKELEYDDKAYEHFHKSKAFKEEANQYRAMAQKILNEAKSKGYTISSKEVLKDAAEGERIFIGLLGQQYAIANNSFSRNDGVNSIAGYYAGKLFSNYLYGNPNETSVSTTKYKVRK